MGEPLTLPQAAQELGLHYMTVYRYVRTGRLPAKRARGTWQIDPRDLDMVRRGAPEPQRRGATLAKPSRARLEARLVAGDEAGAWNLLEAALASGSAPDEVLLELIGPALRSIGTQWEQGEMSIADEHRASSVAARLISRLGARFARRGRKRGTIVLAAAPGDLHGVPVAIAGDLLRWRGFDVVELGADTPAGALAQAALGEPDLVAVGIVCTTEDAPASARQAITALRRALPEVPVLIGGASIEDAGHARRLGADVFTGRRADELVNAVETIAARER